MYGFGVLKKSLVVLLTSGLLFVSGANNSFAAVKAGGICTKTGVTEITGGKKYICVKFGNSNIWQEIKNSKNTIKTLSAYEKTKLKAYNAIRAETDAGNADNIKLNYFIGKDFPAELKNLYIYQVKYASKLYGTFFNKKEIINIYLYTEKDADKIKEDSLLGNDYKNFEDWFGRWQQGIDRQHNLGLAASYIQRNGIWQGFAGLVVFSGSSSKSLRPYSIQVMPHEYWHVVQDFYMQRGRGTLFSDSKSYDTRFPPTFREGSANTISFALASNSFQDYLKLYTYFISEKKLQSEIPFFSALKSKESVIKTLNNIEFREGNPEGFEASYSIGQLLYEWVIAEYGFEGYRKIIENQLVGNSFDDNLQKSLGISKSQLYDKAASHILAAFNN